jgi:hypothetical protein
MKEARFALLDMTGTAKTKLTFKIVAKGTRATVRAKEKEYHAQHPKARLVTARIPIINLAR